MEADGLSGTVAANISIREMRFWDIIPLYRLHMSLSSEERRFYHPFPYVPWKVLLFLIVFFIMSDLGVVGRAIVPRVSFYALVAKNESERNLSAFAYLQWRKKQLGRKRVATLGIVVDKNQRGRGVAKALMRHLLMLKDQLGIDEIHLTVMQDNQAAISLYKGLGFRVVSSDYEIWQGEICPFYKMEYVMLSAEKG